MFKLWTEKKKKKKWRKIGKKRIKSDCDLTLKSHYLKGIISSLFSSR